MKKLLSIAAIVALSMTALVLVQCDSVNGGNPTNVKLEALTDSTVKVTWSAPSEGTPDKYVVSFMETGTSSYVELTPEPTTTTFEHDPAGKTGKYMVTAVFGSTEYNSATTPTTAPIATAALTIAELNATGNSGYGWDRTTGDGATYTMTEASRAASVDFYITDFIGGYAGPIYSIASPDLGPSDPSGVVPAGSWRVNGFTNPLANENSPLPVHNTTTYFSYTDLTTDPILVGCWTADGCFALVKLSSYNIAAGTVSAQSWYQLVKGLRLIQH